MITFNFDIDKYYIIKGYGIADFDIGEYWIFKIISNSIINISNSDVNEPQRCF